MEEQLIELVCTYELLFDPSSKEYRNQQARKEAWEEIGREIGVSGNDCKDMWTKLRNAYTNARKRRKSKPGQLAKNIPKWRFEDQMSFLEPTLEQKTFYGPTEYGEWEDEDYTDGAETYENGEDPPGHIPVISHIDDSVNSQLTPTNTPPTPLPPPPSPPPNSHPSPTFEFHPSSVLRKERKRRRVFAEPTVTHCPSLPSTSAETIYAYDDTEMFFLSLARTVKKLKPEEQVRVKMEISNAVFQAELRNIHRGTDTKPV